MVATQVQKEKKSIVSELIRPHVYIRKNFRDDHAPSPGRARPVVVAVLGWSLFHDK